MGLLSADAVSGQFGVHGINRGMVWCTGTALTGTGFFDGFTRCIADHHTAGDALGAGHDCHGGGKVHAISSTAIQERGDHLQVRTVVSFTQRGLLGIAEAARSKVVLDRHRTVKVDFGRTVLSVGQLKILRKDLPQDAIVILG